MFLRRMPGEQWGSERETGPSPRASLVKRCQTNFGLSFSVQKTVQIGTKIISAYFFFTFYKNYFRLFFLVCHSLY